MSEKFRSWTLPCAIEEYQKLDAAYERIKLENEDNLAGRIQCAKERDEAKVELKLRTAEEEQACAMLKAERAKSAKLVEALKEIQTTLGRAPAVNLDARNGFELATDALKDFPTKSGDET